jgi:hypothetical protein
MKSRSDLTNAEVGLGCILVGATLKSDDLCTVLDSRTAYAKLKNLFYGSDNPNSTPDKDISIEIKDVAQ